MSTLELWLPVRPLHINQVFGNNPLNPDGTPYYSKFLDKFGKPEKGHMGIDFMAVHGQPVYASADGVAQYVKDEHGGEGVYLFTGPATYEGGTCWFNLIYWHLIGDTDPKFPAPIPIGGVRTKVKVGDLIGYANNTGAPFESSGDHLHFGLVPADVHGNPLLPANGYNGCIDAQSYFTKYFATDSGTVLGILSKIVSLLTNYLHK